MTAFIVFHTGQNKVLFASTVKEKALQHMRNLINGREPDFENRKYYYPYVIFDVYVRTEDDEECDASLYEV